jgi:hypothetical protein
MLMKYLKHGHTSGLTNMDRLWILGKIKATPFEFARLIQRIIIAIIDCED